MTIEELAEKAGLRIGSYFVTGGRLYRVARFTKLRIYLDSFRHRLPVDGYSINIAGNQETYIEVPDYVLKPGNDARWIAKMAECVILIPETDEERVVARLNSANELAAPITEELAAEMQRHRTAVQDAQQRRSTLVRGALTR